MTKGLSPTQRTLREFAAGSQQGRRRAGHRHCGGSGRIPNRACPLCHGTDDSGIPCLQPVGDKLVKGKYYMRLLKIPGVELNYAANNRGDPILFRSEIGIAGIVSCFLADTRR